MAIAFPNPSRRYDATRHCIAFSGYDGALEKSFFIEEAAIWRLDGTARESIMNLLAAYDRHREQICEAARQAYRSRGEGSYTLTEGAFS
jgi:hypothetical protein